MDFNPQYDSLYGYAGIGKQFKRYGYDIPKRDDQGNVLRDVNGNILYRKRAHDVVLDAESNPVLIDYFPPGQEAAKVSNKDLSTVSIEELVEIAKNVKDELKRRDEANPLTVASITG